MVAGERLYYKYNWIVVWKYDIFGSSAEAEGIIILLELEIHAQWKSLNNLTQNHSVFCGLHSEVGSWIFFQNQ